MMYFIIGGLILFIIFAFSYDDTPCERKKVQYEDN